MKKIVSLLCAFVMVLSVASISAYAYDFVGTVNLEFDRIEDGAAYYKAVLTVSNDAEEVFITSYKAIYVLSTLYADGTGLTEADVSTVAVDDSHKCTVANGAVNFNCTDAAGALPEDGILGYIKIDNIANLTKNVEIAKRSSGHKFIAVVDGVANKTVTTNFAINGVTVETIGEPAPSITYNHSANVTAALGWKGYDEEFTDNQIGLGFKYEGLVPDKTTAMRWGAYINGGRKYSPVINWSEFGIASGSNVTFYSTYIYGEHGGNPNEAALTDASEALAPSAIFKTDAGYVTTEVN